MKERKHVQTNERADGRMDGWMDEWMDGWMDGERKEGRNREQD